MEKESFRSVKVGTVMLIVFLTAVILFALSNQKNEWGTPLAAEAATLASFTTSILIGTLAGLVLVILRYLFTKNGVWILLGVGILLVFLGDVVPETMRYQNIVIPLTEIIGGIFGLTLVIIASLFFQPATKLPNVFGSSRWATLSDLLEWGLIKKEENHEGLLLGTEQSSKKQIIYDGDMHGLTVAPTRTGKGACAIIPNLLRSNSSILVIDPKGENARRTVEERAKDCDGRKSKVFVIDPWGISTEADKYGEGISSDYLAGFNPLASLDPDDPDLVTDVMMLADALIVASGKEPFWTDEAKALVYGIILYVVADEAEEDNRTLARVRDILSLPVAKEDAIDLVGTFDEILKNMEASDHPMVSAASARISQKADKEFSGVLSSAQSNTHFLDSAILRKSLEGNGENSFSFADLKTEDERITVYLVLPLDRLPTFNRWLRLLVTSAMIDLTRAPVDINKPPVRMILDEFAALDKMPIIEKAYGTMAGLGVQLWVFTQDLGQLMKLYGDKAWQTFVSNAGVFQYFGSRDYETAKYAEHLCGMTTMKKRSFSFGSNASSSSGPQGGSSSSGSSETTSYDDVSRPLAYADEMMTLHRDNQILFIENRYPIVAKKHWWFLRRN
jgi:type IV secretion system protein VirD4